MIRLVLVLALIAGAAVAQDMAKVRAIEYPEVTRLGLPAAPGVEWSVSRDGTDARVTLVGQTGTLDAGDVSRQIPRTRVLSVTTGISPLGVTLDIALGCGCSVEVARLDSALLAIDIRRNAGVMAMGVPHRAEKPAGTDAAPVAQSVADDAADMDGHAAEQTAAARMAPEDEHAPDTMMQDPHGREETHEAEAGQGDISVPAPELTPELEAARQALLEEVGIAAADGLVRLRPGARPRPAALQDDHGEDGHGEDMHQAEAVDPHIGEARPETLHAGDHAAQAQLDAHLSSHDPSSPAPPDHRDDPHLDPATCPSPDLAEMARWPVPKTPFAAALGTLRTALVAPSGDIDPQALEDLVRYYLIQGFGREAQTLLRHPSAAEIRGRALLDDLAAAVEGRALPADALLARAEGCGSAVELWRAAAGIALPDYGSEAGAAILRELDRLPPKLRRMAAQHMVENALVFGSESGARAIFGVLDRTPGKAPAREAFLRGMLDLNAAPAPGEPTLSRLAEADPGLLELYATKLLLHDKPAPAPLIDALQDIEHTRAGQPVVPRLRRLRAALVAAGGAPRDGLDLLRDGADAWPDERAAFAGTARTILDTLDVSDTAALRLAVDFRDFLGGDADSRVLALRFSEALLTAGVPGAARQMLGDVSDLSGQADRLLAARAAFAAGEPQAALSLLDGLNDAAADRLRARIHRSAGNWSLAARTLPDKTGERAYMALLSGQAGDVDGAALDVGDRPLLALLGIDQGAEDGAGSPSGNDPRQIYMTRLQGLLGSASRLRTALDRRDQ